MEVGVIDSHMHFWELSRFSYAWPNPDYPLLYRDFTPAQASQEFRDTPVTHVVFVQVLNDSPDETRHVLSLSDKFPFIAGVVGWVDLTSEKVGETLATLAAHPKFVGVRHVLDFEAHDWLVREDVRRGLRVVEGMGLTFDLLIRPHHFPYAIQIARDFPRLKLVVDHIAKPLMKVAGEGGGGGDGGWRDGMRELAGYSNVRCKVSGMVTEMGDGQWNTSSFLPYVEHVAHCFTPDRLMYGSDWPVCKLAGADYKRVYDLAADLVTNVCPEKTDQDKIFTHNTNHFYNLKL